MKLKNPSVIIADIMNVFKTFEMFLSQPLSIIRERIIQICHVESSEKDLKSRIQFNISPEAAQINVYNSPKVYNLLTSVMYKKKYINDSKKSKIYN